MRLSNTSPLHCSIFFGLVTYLTTAHLYCFIKISFYSWYYELILFISSFGNSLFLLGNYDFMFRNGREGGPFNSLALPFYLSGMVDRMGGGVKRPNWSERDRLKGWVTNCALFVRLISAFTNLSSRKRFSFWLWLRRRFSHDLRMKALKKSAWNL